jgi:PPOX class probable FMN-dependent enzyme
MSAISSIEELEAIYGQISENSTVKEVNYITPAYRKYIDAAPFVALATVGPEGLDCSPRGDIGHTVFYIDERTLMMPDRRGNNRVDSLRNIVRDPRIALMFLVPGSNTTLRVNGRAIVTAAPEICGQFEVEGKLPRSVIAIDVDAAYFQCARALVRSGLWNESAKVDPKSLPTAGQMLAEISDGRVGGEKYDAEWAGRAAKTMW